MSYSKSIAIALTTFACMTALAVDAGAQSRGRSSGGRGPSVGRAAPRSGGQAPRSQGPRTSAPRSNGGGRYDSRAYGGRYDSRVYANRGGYRAPLRSYYYPYYYGYRPGFSIGLGFGYPYYYGSYGYPYYGSYGYGYSYGGYYPAYGGYGYVAPRGGYSGYGGVRIQGAPRNAEVYVDGNYAGVVDDYDGVFQRLDLEPGSHEIEIRSNGRPLTYDVNVTPGQTVTIHANVR
jgi:PEGA domain